MSLITALAISIGGLGGIATWLYLGWLPGLQIWATFIAWACCFHCGGKEGGLKTTIVCNIVGAVLAWIALLLVTRTGLADSLGLALWAGICVGITVAILVLLANIPAFATIPAMVYGYASVAAYALLTGNFDALTAASMENALVTVVVSMVIGAILGYISEKIAVALTTSRTRRAAV
ncbi:MAG TPA: DUF1097 domain-containing protein [Afifellaceae bacterium]|nr:DUF1097 domain-containing protein [Afifellaceae bacterium]